MNKILLFSSFLMFLVCGARANPPETTNKLFRFYVSDRPPVNPPIIISGLRSKVLPAPDGSNTVPLEVPAGYASYAWTDLKTNMIVSTQSKFEAIPGQYQAQMKDALGNTIYSSAFTVVDADGGPKPPAVLNLTASLVASGQIDLAWENSSTENADATVNEIYRSSTPDGKFSLIFITDSIRKSYTDLNVESGNSYYYRVRNVNGSGAAELSNLAAEVSHADSIGLVEAILPVENIVGGIVSPLTQALISVNGLRSKVLPALDGSRSVPLQLPSGAFVSYEWVDANTNLVVGIGQTFDAPVGKYIGVMRNALGIATYTQVFTVINASGYPRPDEPKDLSASLVSAASIRLTWKHDDKDDDGHDDDDENAEVISNTVNEIYRSTTLNSRYVLIHITAKDTTAFIDKNLAPNTTYYYRVRNVNETGASVVSKEVNKTTESDAVPPSAPGTPVVVTAAQNAITITWPAATDNEGVASYNVFINGVKQKSTSGTQFKAEDLTINTSYTFTVTATDPSGNVSEPSESLTAQTLQDNVPPTVPRNIKASKITMSSVELEWEPSTDNSGISGYEVYLNGTLKSTITTTKLPINSLLSNSTNTLSVKAIDGAGNSSQMSEIVTFKTLGDLIAPSVPTNLAVANTTSTSIELTWTSSTDNVGVARYDVFMNGTKLNSTTATSLTASNLSEDVTYNFAVLAVDQAGNASALSSQVSGTVTVTGLKYKYYEGSWTALPDFNKLTPVKTGTSRNVDLSVRRAGVKENFGFLWEGYIIIKTPGTYTFGTVSDAGSKLYFNTTYSHTAKALVSNDGLHSAKSVSATVNIKTAGLYPIAITFFQKTGVAGMFTYWKGPGINWQLIPNSAFSDNNAPMTFKAMLTAIFSNIILGQANNTGAAVESDLNIASEAKEAGLNGTRILKTYPNPFEDKVNVEIYNGLASNQFDVDLYDSYGKLVYSQNMGKVPMGTSTLGLHFGSRQLTPGIYILKVKNNGILYKTIKLLRASE